MSVSYMSNNVYKKLVPQKIIKKSQAFRFYLLHSAHSMFKIGNLPQNQYLHLQFKFASEMVPQKKQGKGLQNPF